MKKSGSRYRILVALLLMLAGNTAHAAISASVDRNQVAMGDSLRLTLTADGDEELSRLELAPLQRDFEILQRSTSSNMSIVNGSRTHIRQLLLDISPRREGALTIPALQGGGTSTRPIQLMVGPEASVADGQQKVIFEAELDRESVYVQGQVLLTLRLQQAVNLDSRSITELQLDNAFVKQLGQNSFQRNNNGRTWLVHEIRYAIFPEHSGTLEIPAQTFTARESVARRSLFDRGGGRQLRRTTDALSVEVLPRPANFPSGTWLPARNVTVEEEWSTPPDLLRAGESATRTVRIVGQGLQGAQLPPVLFLATEGLKYYPDQPVIEDRESPVGLTGIRQDSAALVPMREGILRVPEIRIPWWDTESGKLRHAVLPAREIMIAAGEAPSTGAAPATPLPTVRAEPAEDPGYPTPRGPMWQIIAGITGLGWLLTLVWVAYLKRAPAQQATGENNQSEYRAFKGLVAACMSGNAAQARRGLVNWCATLFPKKQVHSLDQVQTLLEDTSLNASITTLNGHLYGDSTGQWQGQELAALVKVLRKRHKKSGTRGEHDLQLYPQGA